MLNQASLVEVGTTILRLHASTWWVWSIKVGVVAQNFRARLHAHILEPSSTKSWAQQYVAVM